VLQIRASPHGGQKVARNQEPVAADLGQC
jgi:hypothetical protein